jgi:hypothetical protein
MSPMQRDFWELAPTPHSSPQLMRWFWRGQHYRGVANPDRDVDAGFNFPAAIPFTFSVRISGRADIADI